PEGWLTGEIINFYWTFLERREFRSESSLLFLGTYTAYRISNAENATITDNISMQLSEELKHRHLVLIPLNHRSHWSLLVYCRLTKTFYHYDSISRHNRKFAERAVGRFLRVLEPKAKDGFYFKPMQTPQQNNDFDCGIYVLAIAEELARRYINHTKRNTAPRVKRPSAPISTPSTGSLRERYVEKDSSELARRKTTPTGSHTVRQTAPISRALTSDLLMPRFSNPFASSFSSAFVSLCKDPVSNTFVPEPLLRGGGSGCYEQAHATQSSAGSSKSREERIRAETRLMEKAGLPRDFWQVTVEDIEYPHCMRQRIRKLVLDLQRQQISGRWAKR
ncbi:hypothetical protein FBU59_002518, partial [Linderina macrospora]